MTAPRAPGAVRRLQRLTTPSDRFHVVALDHRDSLRSAATEGGLSLDDEDLRQFKREVLAVATPHVSGVMLDPELSWPSFAVERVVAPEVGVICALEAQGYESDPEVGNTWLPGWDPTLLARSGADAAKLLVLYRPDGSKLARSQERLVRTTVEACAELELPLFVEPVPVGVGEDQRGDAVVRSVERFTGMGPMVLKLPYPGDEACEHVQDACAGTPWALLSWGADFDLFEHQLARAVVAGCAGFMVGRAVWREALDPRGRDEALPLVAERLARLAALAG
jgi:tagatose-1,6-bisphosphate aldolase